MCCPCIVNILSRWNYQLCTFMVIDEYCEGQVVQHSLLEMNGDWHMTRALEHFVHVNPGIGKKL